jgi:dTDP-4-dehydrorhamnose reductase
MKVLITGAAGQLGSEFPAALAGHDVVALASADLDITDAKAVTDVVDVHRPDMVVNAAAYTKVDAAETDIDAAWAVNAAGPWHLARACAGTGAALVHVSTDYVFDGTLDRPYTEFDPTNPVSAYGRTKEAGERLVRQTLDRHWIVRTAWVHGRHGGNFVKTMLRLGAERGAVSVVDDQRGSPTFADDLAASIVQLMDEAPYGTYHRTNSGSCTWFELAQRAYQLAGLDVDVTPITTEQFGAPAPRPANSVLENRAASMLGLPPLRSWEEGLQRLVSQLV